MTKDSFTRALFTNTLRSGAVTGCAAEIAWGVGRNTLAFTCMSSVRS